MLPGLLDTQRRLNAAKAPEKTEHSSQKEKQGKNKAKGKIAAEASGNTDAVRSIALDFVISTEVSQGRSGEIRFQ